MNYINPGLPEYPCCEDVWDRLKKESRPIVVYGMGNGADKLFRRFELLGIKISDIFASDGFVRGHSFRGMRVKSFSEIKETYSDFVIVLSFASNRPEVIEMLLSIDGEREMYVPDMPVVDESEYFDREFYNANYDKIKRTYELLADEKSKAVYASVIKYRLSGRMSDLFSAYTEKDEMYSLISQGRNISAFVDAGAYNGDTAREAVTYFKGLTKIYAIEPDPKNYRKLEKYASCAPISVVPINAACYSECCKSSFISSGNRNSSISSTASYEHKGAEVELLSIDSLELSSVDYIKYDVEGSEREALTGSIKTVKKYTPELLVSLYHRSRDIFDLPMFLSEEFSGYDLYVTRLRSVPAWEINLILKAKS